MDFSLINIPFFAAAMGVLAVAFALHVLGAALRGKYSKILGYIGVGVHLPLFVLLSMAAAPLEFLVLVFMASIFVYTLSHYVVYYCRKNEANDLSATSDAAAIEQTDDQPLSCNGEEADV